MTGLKSIPLLLILIAAFLFPRHLSSCSMYKVSAYGKTMVGSNYDAYYLTSRIWFETGKNPGHYGAVFSGGRFDGAYGFAPQSGMNEYGLSFSGAAIPISEKQSQGKPGKKQIASRTTYLKDILHLCKTIDEAKEYINQYDHSTIDGDIFMYVDKSGRYLIVEPDSVYIGSDSKYLLSNFCRSVTKEEEALKMSKYRKGIEFVKHKLDSSLSFCKNLSDTMSVCREKIGDGTLLTCIADLNDGIVYYYFFHDYKNVVKYDLQEELKKGDHVYEVPELFPNNIEYKHFCNFQTPQHNSTLELFMFVCAALFFFSALSFFISFFIKIRATKFAYIKLLLFVLCIILCFYALVLIKNEHIFYFPAPYKDYKFSILNVAAYTPFLLLLIIIPLLMFNKKLFREKLWNSFARWLFTLNNLVYLVLIVLFGYWGLFTIFN